MTKNKKHIKLGYTRLSPERIKLFFEGSSNVELYLHLNVDDPVMGKGCVAELWLKAGASKGIVSLVSNLIEMRLEDQKNFPR